MNKKLIIAIVMGIFSSIFGSQAQSSKNIEVIPVAEFKDCIEQNDVQLIDVRTPEEYAEGKIKDAENINFFDADFTTQFGHLKKDEPIYLYCRSGGRSNKAAQKLEKLGFTKIYDLQGGITAWNK
jgi:rhodanese-related sulfurtransferase